MRGLEIQCAEQVIELFQVVLREKIEKTPVVHQEILDLTSSTEEYKQKGSLLSAL